MKPNNKTSYNRIADKWEEARAALPLNQAILDLISLLKKSGRVLDIGCGTGYPIAKYLSEQGFCVTGIDFSKKMLEKAKGLELKNTEFVCCDFFEYNPKLKFDAIIAYDSFFHFPLSRQESIYSIVSGWLKIGGYLLFTHGKKSGELIGKMFDQAFYYSSLDTQTVIALLKNNGFEIENAIEDYKDGKGDRDLLILAKKIK